MTRCPLCGMEGDPRILHKSVELHEPVLRLIQHENPAWSVDQGICPTCVLDFAERYAAQRSAEPLNTVTDPHTTFPFYHFDEETVLAQWQQLPDYATFDGTGVTIGFLDSGYYPHPDLTTTSTWHDPPAWETLNGRELQAFLSQQELRLAHYVDLTDDSEKTGLASSSLWDGAGDSWHGQMTSTIAAGNGSLSNGHFRGYASASEILPIKIGRGGGRIPEEDILRGFQWLLRDENWERYNVRVVNVSVGGDFLQPWHSNPVCAAAEELSARGVLVAAAAGNSNQQRLLAPAQSPSVLTVGGVDDQNRRWNPDDPHEVRRLSLFPHNWGRVRAHGTAIAKPEILALGRWMPAPILPVSPVFKEMHAIDGLRRILIGDDQDRLDEMLEHWGKTLHIDPIYVQEHPGNRPADWLGEMWQALRKRMNAHKWIHAHYQHVDGTSVAVAQVSAVAAQMVQANPSLDATRLKALLMESALPPPHLPREKVGSGLIQPLDAVTAALRVAGGPLVGYPRSGTTITRAMYNVRLPGGVRIHELQKLAIQGKVFPGSSLTQGVRSLLASATTGTRMDIGGRTEVPVYFGVYAPQANGVSLVGSFNGWMPDGYRLVQGQNGWWHGIVDLPQGAHSYRFWCWDARNPEGDWLTDPENRVRQESGYTTPHSMLSL